MILDCFSVVFEATDSFLSIAEWENLFNKLFSSSSQELDFEMCFFWYLSLSLFFIYMRLSKVKFGNEFEDEIKIISFLFQKMIKRELSYVSEFSCLVKFFLWVNFENSRIDVLIIF